MKRPCDWLPTVLILLLAACAAPTRPDALPAPPNVDFASLPETEQYAQAFNVSRQEAGRRMQIQQWLGESNLEARLAADVEVRTVRYTHAELRAIQAQVTDAGRELGITVNTSTDVINNRVTVYVANAAELRQDLTVAGVQLAPAVEIKEIGAPRPAIAPGSTR